MGLLAVGKLRFLNSSLYGRVGYAGLAVLYAKQHESTEEFIVELDHASWWSLEILLLVGPREWPWGLQAPLC